MKQSGTNKKQSVKAKKPSAAGMMLSRIFSGRGTVVGEKLRVGVTPSSVAKYVVYAAVSLFLIILRATFFARFRPFGASPDILIAAVAAIGLFEGAYAGAVFGVSIGFISDALGGIGIVLLPVVYMLVGYICGVIATDYYKRSWLLFLLFDLAAAAARLFTTLLYVMLTWHTFDLSVVFKTVLMPELYSTLVISPVPALLLLPVYLIFRKKKKDMD